METEQAARILTGSKRAYAPTSPFAGPHTMGGIDVSSYPVPRVINAGTQGSKTPSIIDMTWT